MYIYLVHFCLVQAREIYLKYSFDTLGLGLSIISCPFLDLLWLHWLSLLGQIFFGLLRARIFLVFGGDFDGDGSF